MLGFGRHLAIIAVMPIADAVVHTLLFHFLRNLCRILHDLDQRKPPAMTSTECIRACVWPGTWTVDHLR
jgi:hypothetical protein